MQHINTPQRDSATAANHSATAPPHTENRCRPCYITKLYLRTDKDQRSLYESNEERAEAFKLTELYMMRFCERHGLMALYDKDTLLTKWLPTHVMTENRGDYAVYWQSKAMQWMPLSMFAQAVGRVVMDEAEVERNFVAEARVYFKSCLA